MAQTKVPAAMTEADLATQAELDATQAELDATQAELDATQAELDAVTRTTLMTMQASTSGTAKDFTGIPAGVKRIVISLSGVSLSGTDQMLFQIGDSGGIEATGYLGASSQMVAATTSQNYTTGFGVFAAAAANVVHGSLTLTLMDATTNLWAAAGVFALSNVAATVVTAGTKALSATLDRVRITSTGSDTFDAGNISVAYEGVEA